MPARPRAVALVGLGLVLFLGFVLWRPAAAQNEPAGRKLAFLVGVKSDDHELLKDLVIAACAAEADHQTVDLCAFTQRIPLSAVDCLKSVASLA